VKKNIEFCSKNDGFCGAKKGIMEFHPSFFFNRLEEMSGTVAE